MLQGEKKREESKQKKGRKKEIFLLSDTISLKWSLFRLLLCAGYRPKYNKFYIGLEKDGIAKNYISFKPKKQFIYLFFKTNEIPELSEKLDESGLDTVYQSCWKQYRVRFNGYKEYKEHSELIKECVGKAMEYFNILEM